MEPFSLFYDPAIFLNDEGVREAYGGAGGCAVLAEAVYSMIRNNFAPWEVVAEFIHKLHREVEDTEDPIETMYEEFAECGLRIAVGGVDEISAHAAAFALAKWVLNEIWSAAVEPEQWLREFTPPSGEKCEADILAEPPEKVFDLTSVRANYRAVVKHFAALPPLDITELKTLLKQEAILAAKARRAKYGVVRQRLPSTTDVASAPTPPSAPQTPPEAAAAATAPAKAHKRGTVNQRMLEALHNRPESRNWSARQFAFHLNCSVSTVHETQAWRTIQKTREQAKRERIDSRADRQRGRHDD